MDGTDGEHGRPQGEGEAAVPRHRREGDRRHHVEHGERRRRSSPPARPHGRARANRPRMIPRCWSRPNVRSAARLWPNTPYQPASDVQRARAVEVQEVDVGHVAAGDALGEVEHEALFHRPAGEAVQPAQRDGDEHADQGEAGPRPDARLPLVVAARPSRRARTRSGRRGRRSRRRCRPTPPPPRGRRRAVPRSPDAIRADRRARGTAPPPPGGGAAGTPRRRGRRPAAAGCGSRRRSDVYSSRPPTIAPSRLAPKAAVESTVSRNRLANTRLAAKIGRKARTMATTSRGT